MTEEDCEQLLEAFYAPRVQRGVALLDEVRPEWRLLVGPLRMESCHHCALGQLYGSYGEGQDALDLASARSAKVTTTDFGFEVATNWEVTGDAEASERLSTFSHLYHYEALSKLWNAERVRAVPHG